MNIRNTLIASTLMLSIGQAAYAADDNSKTTQKRGYFTYLTYAP